MAIEDILNQVITDNEEKSNEQKIFVGAKTKKVSCNFDLDDETLGVPNIKIFGVGGAGNNIVEYLGKLRNWPLNINFWALNTDKKTLIKFKKSQLNSSLFLIGEKKLKGFGSGGNPSIGRDAFTENKADVEKILSSKTDILFIIAGLGKGTGSGVSPEIAKIARANNITTVGIVTVPSINVEGRKVYENSLESYSELEKSCDSLCAISNEKIISTATETTFFDQLSKGNREIGSTISDFVDIVTSAGKLNIDYHDLESFLKNNKYFFHTLIVLDKAYNYEKLNTLITDAITKSYSNINFELADIEVIVNFKINSGTQSKLIEDTKNILERISNNSNIKLIYGIEETSASDNVEISLFISNSHQMQQSSVVEKNSKTVNVKSLLENDAESPVSRIKHGDTTRITRKLFDWDLDDDDEDQALTRALDNEKI
ncbi:MAG: hypothetical protein LBV53_00840 [Mycoplasmataceae bacterium]|nr:hypothetical protein [Mycoplasmataceae bacterium]